MKHTMVNRLPPELLQDETRLKIQIAAYLRTRMFSTKQTIYDVENWKKTHGKSVNMFLIDNKGVVVSFTPMVSRGRAP